MFMPTIVPPVNHLPTELQNLLETHDAAAFESCLDTLFAQRQQSLFHALGRLTRDLHQSIAHLSETTDDSPDDVPSTRQHLQEALAISAEAAQHNLALAERLRPQAARLGQKARNVLIAPRDAAAAQQLACRSAAFAEVCLSEFTCLVEAQAWQDLSGQRLQQVAAFVDKVDDALLELARLTGTISGAPPTDAHRTPCMSTQCEVDRLLSDFGF